MDSTIIKSHTRTGEGISALVLCGGIDLSDGAMAWIRKPASRSAWPLKFLPKPLEGGEVGHLGVHTRLERAHGFREGRLGGEDWAEARRSAASAVIELQRYATALFAGTWPVVENRFTDDCYTTDTSLGRARSTGMKAKPHMGAANPTVDHKNGKIASFPDMHTHTAAPCLGVRAEGVAAAARTSFRRSAGIFPRSHQP